MTLGHLGTLSNMPRMLSHVLSAAAAPEFRPVHSPGTLCVPEHVSHPACRVHWALRVLIPQSTYLQAVPPCLRYSMSFRQLIFPSYPAAPCVPRSAHLTTMSPRDVSPSSPINRVGSVGSVGRRVSLFLERPRGASNNRRRPNSSSRRGQTLEGAPGRATVAREAPGVARPSTTA